MSFKNALLTRLTKKQNSDIDELIESLRELRESFVNGRIGYDEIENAVEAILVGYKKAHELDEKDGFGLLRKLFVKVSLPRESVGLITKRLCRIDTTNMIFKNQPTTMKVWGSYWLFAF